VVLKHPGKSKPNIAPISGGKASSTFIGCVPRMNFPGFKEIYDFSKDVFELSIL